MKSTTSGQIDSDFDEGSHMGGAWQFLAPDQRGVNQNPNHGEHFGAGTERDLPEILVREALQNSLDVPLPGAKGPVRVAFRLGRIDDPATSSVAKWFQDLHPHLDAADPRVLTAPDLTKPMRYLVVEDFNTRGLTGDENVGGLVSKEDAKGNNYYHFWRNIGISGKSDDSKGRWGLGKAVFYRASRINTYFGLTLRHDDPGRFLLMGLAFPGVHHTADGKPWREHGYWGVDNGPDSPVLPEADPVSAVELIKAFGLTRTPSESGLSVIVPWLDRSDEADGGDDWSAKSLAGAVAAQFYLPVLSGELLVKITEEDGSVIEVRPDNLTELVQELSDEHLRAPRSVVGRNIELAKRWIASTPADFQILPRFGTGRPSWKDWDLDAFIEPLRETFAETGRIQFRVPVTVHRDGGTHESYFDVLLEHDEEQVRGIADYFRAGLKVPKAQRGKMSKARALVLIPAGEHGALATMLGDAENPAHTIWDHKRLKPYGYDKYAEATILLVQQAPVQLHQRLLAGSSKPDRKALKDAFAMTLVQPKAPSPAKKGEGGADPDPKGGSETWSLTRRAGGFVVACDEGPDAVRVTIGYARPRGNPFKPPKDGMPVDFDVRSPEEWGLEVDLTNATLEHVASNEFIVRRTTDSDPWGVRLSGFDEHRDLAVKVNANAETES